MDSRDNNTTPTISLPNVPTYEQLHTLLSAASKSIEACNKRIEQLEGRIKTLEEQNMLILAKDEVDSEGITP